MTYATAKLERSSFKYSLIKVAGRLNLNDYLVLHSGSVYKAENIDEDIFSLYQNDIEINQVNEIPTGVQEWYYDKPNKIVYVWGTPSSTDVFIAQFYLNYTNGDSISVGSNPNTPSVDLRLYESRINSVPVLSQTIKSVVEGVLELSISNMVINNADESFDKYLGANYSFKNMYIECWDIIDSIDNIRYSFIGYISSIEKSGDTVSFSLYDILDQLRKDCVLGLVCKTGTNRVSPFINIAESHIDRPIKVYFGKDSPYRTYPVPTAGATSYGPFRAVDVSSLDNAICYGSSSTLATNTNRSYVLGITASFISGDGFQDMSAAVTATTTSGAYSRLTVSVANAAKFSIGDTPSIVTNTGTHDLQIIDINYASGYIYVPNVGLFASASAINNSAVMRLEVIMDDTSYFLTRNTHYTVSTGTYPTGYLFLNYVTILLINNVEGALGMPRAINPNTDLIKFKIKPKTANQNHADVLKLLFQSLNFSLNAASFTTAESDLASNVMFSIPFKDQETFPSYIEVIQSILQSSLGYIYLGDNFEVGYSLFKTPTSTTIIDEDDIIDGSFSVSFDYEDIETSIDAYNENDDRFNPLVKSSISATVDNNNYFYKLELEEFKFSHVLEDMTVKIDDHVNLKSNRKIKISFSSASKLFDSKIGDDIVLRRAVLPGNVNEMVVKIIELTKLPNRVDVVVTDLKGL